MTNMPEAKLARRQKYVTQPLVWLQITLLAPCHDHGQQIIIKVLSDNAQNARNLVKEVIPRIFENIGSLLLRVVRVFR